MPEFKQIRISCPGDVERLYPLIREYLTDPKLPLQVTGIIIDTWDFLNGHHYTWKDHSTLAASPLRDEVHIAIEDRLQGLGLDQKATKYMLSALDWKLMDDNVNMMGRRNQFVFTAIILFLSLCKNISTLYVGKLPSSSSPLSEYILKSNYGQLLEPCLQHLEHIEVIGIDHEMLTEYPNLYETVDFMELFQYFHRLPSVKSIRMAGVGEYQNWREFFVPHCSNFKRIHMEHTDMGGAMLVNTLRMPKALEELRFSIGGLQNPDSSSTFVIPRTIGKVLLEHRTSLRILDLDIDGGIRGYDQENSIDKEEWEEEDEFITNKGADWPEEVAEILEDRQGNLELQHERYGLDYLRLDEELSVSPNVIDDQRQYDNTIGSLHDFEALTHLRIGWRALLGPSLDSRPFEGPRRLSRIPPSRLADMLPPNLQSFHLYGYKKGEFSDVDSHIEEFMEQKATLFPLLKDVLGIEETLADVRSVYGTNPEALSDEQLWKRPERKLDWVEI